MRILTVIWLLVVSSSAVLGGAPATQALRSAIQATRPDVLQLPVSASNFVNVLLADACNDCGMLLHLDLLTDFSSPLRSIILPASVVESYDRLQELYSLLESQQQPINETTESWQQELVQVENDNYQRLLTDTQTTIDQMLNDLEDVASEYMVVINDLEDVASELRVMIDNLATTSGPLPPTPKPTANPVSPASSAVDRYVDTDDMGIASLQKYEEDLARRQQEEERRRNDNDTLLMAGGLLVFHNLIGDRSGGVTDTSHLNSSPTLEPPSYRHLATYDSPSIFDPPPSILGPPTTVFDPPDPTDNVFDIFDFLLF